MIRYSKTIRKKGRTGFSLLEVILALAISVVLLTAIGYAMRLHLVILDRQQKEIESRQIARSVLTMVSNDIRAATQYRAQDFSSLQNLELSQAMIAGIAASMAEDGDDSLLGADTGAGGGEEQEGDEDAPQFGDLEAEECASCRPTFVGNARMVSVDVSRLPRVDEYNPLIANLPSDRQLPSDVKTVAYFISESQPVVKSKLKLIRPTDYGKSGGLYRRQIDRAVAAYREETPSDVVDQYSKLVAPEVAQITMRYFNGEEWQNEWDSEEAGSFPFAIEVVVVIDPQRADPNEENYRFNGYDPETMQLYRSVIHLPTAGTPPGGE